MASRGTVHTWHQDEGWGVIDSDETPGGTYAGHWSLRVEAVVADGTDMRMMGLRPGTDVEFEWSAADPAVQGYRQTADVVWPAGEDRPPRPKGAFSTALWLSVGDPDTNGLTTMREADLRDLDIPYSESPILPTTVGTVRLWRGEEGWGVLDSAETPGGAWTHFSEVVGEGFRILTPGQAVEFEYENADQDGYDFRALNVRGR